MTLLAKRAAKCPANQARRTCDQHFHMNLHWTGARAQSLAQTRASRSAATSDWTRKFVTMQASGLRSWQATEKVDDALVFRSNPTNAVGGLFIFSLHKRDCRHPSQIPPTQLV